ncbi:uncharacterized protein N7446_005571 [Penicillium canescens]|uniref:Uncharacterized protein n=1 Tax=Penicillium canescens TaxID=5083 RepID=A0AAD6II21_PENCN|nr:uncharacterized protein N7446_005571 [Penicillium canescens]KAJ6050191.1 hypothetical protein N7444_006907 [Penicillium canescens]KAJ6050943.1 hypothetical protein N7460_001477 [Penicillium canescens]KAJ6061451.1 hypothetical protein N7446_005571 [Penicillium canescens]
MPYRARTYNLPSAGTGDTYFPMTTARNAYDNHIITNERTLFILQAALARTESPRLLPILPRRSFVASWYLIQDWSVARDMK